ncbi:ATPase [Ferroglobus placidus DSM 10642]|uniref:ATPase n=1 Tax=Ferroglobus placidus (strain DSM 10642 / AEDII12DO) TaxID=589924 RepID=D3S0P6_FERPA|nr:ATP-binding protein [Ferroglobus placidus]ADC66287.1 ATPase [Ferroglobus placidus DSM 10642]
MYFDPRPKRRREDLYDRDEELEEFVRSVKRSPLTVVTGIRRLGKTSLILVGLSDKPSVMVDLRGVPQSIEGLYRRIESAMNEFFRKHRSVWQKLRNELKRITGVQVLGSGISLSWREKRVDLVELLRNLEGYEVVLVFDEVQYLRGPVGKEVAEVLAYLYDHSELKIVLSGSEIGLLYDFLGVENPKAPLYGRYFREIRLERFDYFKSKDFLIKGFGQVGLDVEEDLIEYACERLDGIVGWLVHFGLKCLEKEPSEGVVDEVLGEASKLSLEEFNKFLEKHKPAEKRIFEIAKAIAIGKKTWSEIKKYLESVEGRTIPDSSLNRAIKSLLKASFVEKIVEGRNVYYQLTDPVLKYALLKE